MESGNKYHREIFDLTTDASVTVDVYAVLEAFKVTCPARQHAIKKLLCAGLRGKGDAVQDLTEAGDCVARAVRLAQREGVRRGSAFLAQGNNVPRKIPDAGLFTPKTHTTCKQCGESMSFHAGQDKEWPERCDRCVERFNGAQPMCTRCGMKPCDRGGNVCEDCGKELLAGGHIHIPTPRETPEPVTGEVKPDDWEKDWED